jgi:hypothetical protein
MNTQAGLIGFVLALSPVDIENQHEFQTQKKYPMGLRDAAVSAANCFNDE